MTNEQRRNQCLIAGRKSIKAAHDYHHGTINENEFNRIFAVARAVEHTVNADIQKERAQLADIYYMDYRV